MKLDGRGRHGRHPTDDNLSSSFDHRFVDGCDAAALIQALKERLGILRRSSAIDVSSASENTNALTTTFFRHGASSGAVGSTHAEWDRRETEPSVIES